MHVCLFCSRQQCRRQSALEDSAHTEQILAGTDPLSHPCMDYIPPTTPTSLFPHSPARRHVDGCTADRTGISLPDVKITANLQVKKLTVVEYCEDLVWMIRMDGQASISGSYLGIIDKSIPRISWVVTAYKVC